MQKQKLYLILAILILAMLAFILNFDLVCQIYVKTWKDNASKVLNEFLIVDQELNDNASIVNDWKYETDKVFISNTDFYKIDTAYGVTSFPALRKWFNKYKNSFISYDNNKITVNYKYCSGYRGVLYYSKEGIRPSYTRDWKPQVIMVDSLDMNNNWNFLISYCKNCDD